MKVTIDMTEQQIHMLENEVGISIIDSSGDCDIDYLSYAIGMLIETNEVD